MLLVCNVTDEHKLPPLVIGKSKHPQCFTGVKSLPLPYKVNKTAWIINVFFQGWLRTMDTDAQKRDRHILLLIDNYTAHNTLPVLKNVTEKFLPTTTTSKLQSLDQGLIENFKVNYNFFKAKSEAHNFCYRYSIRKHQ